MSAPFFSFEKKKTVLLCLKSSLSLEVESPAKAQKTKPRKRAGGVQEQKGPKKGRRDSKFFFSKRKKKRKRKRKLTKPEAPQKKKKKRDARTHCAISHLHSFFSTKVFSSSGFWLFFPRVLSLCSFHISCRFVAARWWRERERERVKGREEEEDFVHTFF